MDSTHIKARPHLCEHESSWRMLTFQTAPVFCFQSLDCSRSATVARNQKHNSIHELLGGLIYVIINSLGCVVSAHIWLGILWEINVQAMSSTVATATGNLINSFMRGYLLLYRFTTSQLWKYTTINLLCFLSLSTIKSFIIPSTLSVPPTTLCDGLDVTGNSLSTQNK